MAGKRMGNFERLQRWREKGGSVEKAELHARLMTVLIMRKDKLTGRQLQRLCATLVPGPYERALTLAAGVSETATAEELRAALNLIDDQNGEFMDGGDSGE